MSINVKIAGSNLGVNGIFATTNVRGTNVAIVARVSPILMRLKIIKLTGIVIVHTRSFLLTYAFQKFVLHNTLFLEFFWNLQELYSS